MYDENILPPFYVDGPGSASFNLLTAIPLLTMYCSTLPGDIFTRYSPNWYLETRGELALKEYKVYIEMPIVCPLLEPIEVSFYMIIISYDENPEKVRITRGFTGSFHKNKENG